MTWKRVDTPAQRPLCQLLASVLRTNETESGSLPTPQAMDAKGYSDALRHKFRKTGHLKHWVHGTALAIHSPTGKSSWPEPRFVAWLMGYPATWLSARPFGASATRSSRKSRPK